MLRKLLLVGALQGWASWALWKAHELKVWPATDATSQQALLYLCLALPLAIYLSAGLTALTRSRRLILLGAVATLFTLLGGYSGWVSDIPEALRNNNMPFHPGDLLAAAVLGFVLVPLLAHFNKGSRNWTYHELFETAWRNAMLCITATALTGLFWVVLVAGSGLLNLIGLGFMQHLIGEPIFFIPVTSTAFGTAFALGLARAEMVITLRRFQLSMLAWLLPLLMGFVLVWVAALPFTGVESLFKTHDAAFIMLWCAALCINFVNAAYQDGQVSPPYGKYLSMLLAWAWSGLLVVVGVAWWAMWLRIAQHGWSEDRVWGVFVALMATIYVAGYALSAFRTSAWLPTIGKTNIAAAIVLCLGLLALLSPIADARRIAVNSQMYRLSSQAVAIDKFDFSYLRWEAGVYGQSALHILEAGITHPDREALSAKAKQILAKTARYGDSSDKKVLSPEQMQKNLRVLPDKAVLDAKLLSAMAAENSNWQLKQCFELNPHCAVWLVDLNNDKALDAVVLVKQDWNDGATALVMQNFGDHYRLIGSLSLPNNHTYSKCLAQIEQGKFKLVKPEFSDVEMFGQRLQVTLDKPSATCDDDTKIK